MGFFKHHENEPIRVQKLNAVEFRVSTLESGGVGGTILWIDGGDANNTGAPYVAIDGGSA